MQQDINGLRQVRVVQKRQEAEGVCSFELACLSGKPLPAFTAGAHIDVHINGVVRQYSLCNDPAESARYRVGVLREPLSRGGSVAMHEALNEGDVLDIAEPRNHFALSEDDHHTVLVAGGIGITPLLSMAYALQRAGVSFELHYCVRTRGRAAFLDELAAALVDAEKGVETAEDAFNGACDIIAEILVVLDGVLSVDLPGVISVSVECQLIFSTFFSHIKCSIRSLIQSFEIRRVLREYRSPDTCIRRIFHIFPNLQIPEETKYSLHLTANFLLFLYVL